MLHKSRLVSIQVIIISLLLLTGKIEAQTPAYSTGTENSSARNTALARGFANPPSPARPAVYWVWVNGLTNRKQLTYELEQMKAKGISTAYIFDVGARDPAGIVPAGPAFMGPESVKAIGYAVREATRLGVEIGIVTSSSWNCGGPWVKPEHASMGLYHCQKTVKGPVKLSEVLPFPTIPKQTPKGANGLPLYYKDVAVMAVPDAKPLADPEASLSSAGAPPAIIEDVNSIVNLTEHIDKQGRLEWRVPAGTWTIMRFVCANTGATLKLPSPASEGLAIDHFSSEATKAHFDYLISRLRAELGDFEDTALKHAYVCSYELSGSTWTPDFLEEFKKRRGYDMTMYLPVLSGSIVRDRDVSERFNYDFRKTLGDLLVDAFYKTAREISNRNGLLLCAEAGGPGPPLHQVPVDALKALGALDIPRGEFWKEHNVWVVKETACASHIYGKKIVDMESFTSWRHWQDGPFELKPIADRAMCGGTNHFTLHTSAHNPPDAGLPGWVYHAGTHINSSLAWWPKAKPFIDYLSRCSYLLQQGLFVGDVCYYYGDQGFNFVPPKHVDPSLGYGYDYDVTNAEVILTRMSVDGGRLVLPDGMSYELLVLPDRDDMDLQVLRRIQELVRTGATIVGRKPTKSNGLTGYPGRDEEVRRLADSMWGPCDGADVKEHQYGDGKIICGRSLREILQGRGIGPDFSFTSRNGQEADLDYIHRRTENEDIYFVSNKNMQWTDVDCIFRVSGKAPELWDPATGQISGHLVCNSAEGGTKVPLRLPPAGSVFVVFQNETRGNHIVSISRDPASIELLSIGRDDVNLRAWKNGTYFIKSARGRQIRADVDDVPAVQEITGPWEVRFPAGWGAPPSRVFDELISWTADSEDGVKYFSGVATYYNQFDLSADQLQAGRRVYLDLGRVRFVADVYLNGKNLGILWKPPFRMDVTSAAKPGRNKLVIEVANTWSNRLVGDANSPEGQRYCRTNMTHSLTWEMPWKDTPLLESGLLGPVRLVPAKDLTVNVAR
ncbi:MAG: glycosyl hydrolase [Planctomycetota bacterium]